MTIRKPIARSTSILLGISIWVIFFAAWELAVIFEGVNLLLVPPPEQVLAKLYELMIGGRFPGDIAVSAIARRHHVGMSVYQSWKNRRVAVVLDRYV